MGNNCTYGSGNVEVQNIQVHDDHSGAVKASCCRTYPRINGGKGGTEESVGVRGSLMNLVSLTLEGTAIPLRVVDEDAKSQNLDSSASGIRIKYIILTRRMSLMASVSRDECLLGVLVAEGITTNLGMRGCQESCIV